MFGFIPVISAYQLISETLINPQRSLTGSENEDRYQDKT
jgi:hypothetical protein